MKQTNIYEMHRKAEKSGRAVFSVQQFANVIGKTRLSAAVYLSRMVKKGLIKRIRRGKFAFSDDDLAIASQLIEPSYISLNSALLFHGLVQQVPASVECVTARNTFRFGDLGIIYRKIPGALFYGYEKKRKGNSYILIAEPEKALIDCVYLNCMGRKSAREIREKLDRKKLDGYVRRFSGRGRKKLERWLL